jgi:hypothetical protein
MTVAVRAVAAEMEHDESHHQRDDGSDEHAQAKRVNVLISRRAPAMKRAS